MMNVDLEDKGRFASSRTNPYKYSIESWRKWSDKNNCELFVLTDELVDHNFMGICWQRWYIFDLLEANNIEYNQILSIDADTIVHPDCPNFFEMTDNKFTVCHFDGSWDWVLRSIENYSKHIFGGMKFRMDKYFDSGFWIVNEQHKDFAKSVTDLYNEKASMFRELEKLHTGTEQTPLNFMTKVEDLDMTYLPYEFNMNDMPRREILTEDLFFTKCGWVYQYNALPNNKNNELTDYWMKKTYEHFYGTYKE